MKIRGKPKQRLMAVALAAIIVAGGIPFVVGDHVNEMLTPWRNVPDEPTGNALLDAAVSTAADTLDGVADHPQIKPLREEPQEPATFFHDIFDPNDRIGGWGEWRPDDTQAFPGLGAWTTAPRWHLDPSAAGRSVQVPASFLDQSRDVEQGYRFGNESGYPMPRNIASGNYAYSFLISPLISLESLPVALPEERKEVPNSDQVDRRVGADHGTVDLARRYDTGTGSAAGGPLDPGRILLYIDHKYHLANSTDGLPADRAGVFLLDEQGHLLSNGFLTPLRGPSTTDADDMSGVFSGARLRFTEEAFNLTRWAGQDVRIGFEVGTGALWDSTPREYFRDSTRFQTGAPFYGWAISNVRVEGPAHMHNVRLDRLVYPPDPDGDGVHDAQAGEKPFEALLLNRGRVTEDIEATMTVDDGEESFTCTVRRMGIRPGDAVVVKFSEGEASKHGQDCDQVTVKNDTRYDVQIATTLLRSGHQDLYDADNLMRVAVKGQGLDVRLDGFGPTKPLGEENEVFGANVALSNWDVGAVDAKLRLRVNWLQPGQEDFTPDVQHDASLVEFIEPSSLPADITSRDGPNQTVRLHGRDEHGPASVLADWAFVLKQPGIYNVIVDGTTPGDTPLFKETSASIGVRQAPAVAYKDLFDGNPIQDAKVGGEWNSSSLLHALPPECEDPSADCGEVWELPPTSDEAGLRGALLRGEFEVDPDAAATPIGNLTVEVYHYAMDVRCATRTDTSNPPYAEGDATKPFRCDVFSNVNTPPSAPEQMLTARLVEAPVADPLPGRITGLPFVPTDPNQPLRITNNPVMQVGGSHYRNAYHTGQWLRENFTIPVSSLAGAVGGVNAVPAGRLADVALEFMVQPFGYVGNFDFFGQQQIPSCPFTSKDISCPTWRIAEATVTGVANNGDSVPLLGWNSISGEERGNWYSYYMKRGSYADTDSMRAHFCESSQSADSQFRCPAWTLRSISSIVENRTQARQDVSWHLDEDGFWTNAHQPTPGDPYLYGERAGGAVDQLESPIFQVPADAPTPTLSFEHRFQLFPYNDEEINDGWAPPDWLRKSPSYGDSGMVMVRFFDENLEPATPFLPIYLHQNRFMGTDCDFYRSTDCPDLLLQRDPFVETIDLTNVAVVDYRGSPFGHRAGDSKDPRPHPHPSSNNPHSHADMDAMGRQVDFMHCAADGTPSATAPLEQQPPQNNDPPCRFQIAFRLEVPDPERLEGVSIANKKSDTPVAAGITGPKAAEGWFIDSFQISKGRQAAYDLELVGARLETAYAWDGANGMGLGPRTDALVNVIVQNNGFFTADLAVFDITFQDASDPDASYTTQAPIFGEDLPGLGGQATFEIPVELPPEGDYRVTFNITHPGEIFPGVPLADDVPENDCLVLNPDVESGHSDCTLDSIVPVRPNPQLEMDLRVTPEAGRTGEEFKRQVDIRIRNTGNVVVQDAILKLEKRHPESTTSWTWVVEESPLPGHEASWSSLSLDGPPRKTLLELPDEGTWLVTAFLEPSPQDQASLPDDRQWKVTKQVVLSAFDTIFADTFDEDGLEIDNDMVLPTSQVATHHDAWRNLEGEAPDRDGVLTAAWMWRFGDPEAQRYPDAADASLQLPAADLSSSQRAILSISHNYDLEPGYDGARVEACIGGAASCTGEDAVWYPVHPIRSDGTFGYPDAIGSAGAENPLNPTHDPRTETPAFTGNSADRPGNVHGWVIDEFDLAQLEGFTTPVLLREFDLSGFAGPHVEDNSMNTDTTDPRVEFHPTWGAGSATCESGGLDGCWFRENVNRLNPKPRHDEGYWWSGSAAADPETSETSLTLTLDAQRPEGASARLVYHYWKDDSGTLSIVAENAGGGQSNAEHGSSTPDWAEAKISLGTNVLPVDVEQTLTVNFTFASGEADQSNRGAAVDDVRLEFYTLDAAGNVVVDDTTSRWLLRGHQAGIGVEVGSPSCAPPCPWGWHAVAEAEAPDNAWGVDSEQTTRTQDVAPVWRFGTDHPDQTDHANQFTYPGNAHERLVTPRVDLRGVAGDEVFLTSWWKYDLMENDKRRVLVQQIEPTPEGGEQWGEWAAVETYSDRQSRQADHPRCTNDVPAWCPVEIDVSAYRGQEVRFAFEIETTRNTPDPGTNAHPLGWTWLIDEVGIRAESLVGEPVQLRLRAGTDGSISDGHWMVENVQFVGRRYGGNIAILPDQPLDDSQLAPGETVEVEGVVRNLGKSAPRNLALNISIEARGDVADPELPPVTFLRHGNGTWVEDPSPGSGEIQLVDLLPAGSSDLDGTPTDRVPYAIRIEFPAENPADKYEFVLRVVDANGDVLGGDVDENRGDHERAFVVTMETDPKYELVAFDVDPPTVAATNETVDLALDVKNEGTTTLAMPEAALVNAIRIDDGTTYSLPSVTLPRLGPGERGVATWNITPEQAGLPAGFYRIEVETRYDGLAPGMHYAHLMVGQQPLFFRDDFATDPFARSENAWERGGDMCSDQKACWRHSTAFSDFGGHSILVGNDQAIGYPMSNTQADTPPIDLSRLGADGADGEAAILSGESPFKPFLSVRYNPRLASDDEGDVTIHADVDGNGDYRSLRTATPTPLAGNSADVRQVASFDLFDADGNVVGANEPLLTGNPVSFRFDADLDGGLGYGFALDLVTVSSYDVAVDPEQHGVDLRPGSNKTFFFHVENRGAARDTFNVSIDTTGALNLASVARVAVLNPGITLDPGRSGLVGVRVDVPFQQFTDGAFEGERIHLRVTSEADPNRVATGAIHVNDFIVAPLPDLVTELARPPHEAGPVVEGEQAALRVTVTNDGDRASRSTDLVVFACPTTVSLWQCGDQDMAIEIGSAQLPPLIPSRDAPDGGSDHFHTATFSWIPALGDRGSYQIVAVADPEQAVTQFNRHTSVHSLMLEVAPIERPDLHVTDLRITDARGEPVSRVFAGDTLHIQGTVRNDGTTVAPDVEVRIVNRFTLREQSIGDLNPGGTFTLDAQWIAQPGNWVVLFEALSGSSGDANAENNVKRWPLAVRPGEVEAAWVPGTMHLESGGGGSALLRVENRRDQAAEMLVSLAAADVAVHGVPDSMTLARGASAEVPVSFTASPFLKPGRHDVRVDLLEAATGNQLASAMLEIHAGANRSVRASSDPLLVAPGTAEFTMTFVNQGNAPESLTVRLEAPEDWEPTVLQPTFRLEPGARKTVGMVLEVPAGTPAGSYGLTVASGDVLRRDMVVEVLKRPVWSSDVQVVRNLGDTVELQLYVQNVGNVPATPPLRTAGETTYDVHPAPRPQEPGEARTYKISVPAGDASSLTLPGQDSQVPVDLRPTRPSVEAVHLELQTAGGVTAGDGVDLRFGLLSKGDQAQRGLPARLWVDGVLVAETHVDLSASEMRDVHFRWQPEKPGPRVVTATVGSGDAAVARTAVLEVAPDDAALAIPAPSVLPIILLLAAVLFWRRRS